MPFVKLDTGILDSTLWLDRDLREVFITALLLAEPVEVSLPLKTLKTREIIPNGFTVPAGWYGIVKSPGIGIIRRAMVRREAGMLALEALASPDPESRSADFEGRRMVRVDGGFLILNYMKYRDRDHTAATRQKRLRERRKQTTSHSSNGVTSRDVPVTSRIADADADAEKDKQENLPSFPPDFDQSQVFNPLPDKKSSKHAEFKDLIFRCYAYLNNGELPPWDGSDAKQLSLVIRAKPDLDATKFHQWLANYAASGNINPAARPREFLPRISDYTGGPLNKFGRPCDQN